jgi:hypothetical protein
VSTVPVAGHAFREKRGTGGRVSWMCACGEPLGNTKEGMTREKARILHREHKAGVGIVRVATSLATAPLSPMMPQPERGGIRQVPLCGNAQHPDGPWHVSTPLPFYGPWWNRKARRAQRRYEENKKRWGCGCDAKETA